MMYRCLAFWKVLLVCGLVLFQYSAAAVGTNHYVFAHYMVCIAAYGETVDAFTTEIQAAQSAGLDGFALNVGEWNGPDVYYKTRVKSIYDAAEKMGTDFKLFFSIDNMTNGPDIMEMLRTYGPRPNTLRYQGKIVVSTFASMNTDWNAIFSQLRAEGMDFFFVPDFWPDASMRRTTTLDSFRSMVSFFGSKVDGYFSFAAMLPSNIVKNTMAMGQVCSETGKLFMAGYCPHYWGYLQNSAGRQYYESAGGEGTELQWTNIIQLQPEWVEISTWNDLYESTYLLPASEADLARRFQNAMVPTRYFHGGYLELSKYYIQWYKTGVQPKIDKDALFSFYRTQPRNAISLTTNDVPVTSWLVDVKDEIFTTTLLVWPASLEVSSGGVVTTYDMPAGLHHVRTPFFPGAQTFTLRRKDQTLISLQGHKIESRNVNLYNFFPATDYGYGVTPIAPTQLHFTQ